VKMSHFKWGNFIHSLTELFKPFCGVPFPSVSRKVSVIDTYRLMVHLVVHMNKTSVDIRQGLNLVLEILRDIMSLPKRHLWR
jgi:hypothetical protein